ncbi:MAG: DUF881 domain-containing protein [Chloroflexota bacterium]
MRSNAGVIAVTVIAMFLGVLAVTQIQAQEVYSRSLQLETPASLTTLIASLSERNNSIREESLDLRRRTETARDAIAGGRGSLAEAERQLSQLRVFAGMSAVSGPGITVRIDGPFDERALSDLVNELRNAGAEAVAINAVRIGPRSWFGATPGRALTVDSVAVSGPWQIRAVGATDVMYVAMTRIGGIIGQFELIYRGTRFDVGKDSALDVPALATPLR